MVGIKPAAKLTYEDYRKTPDYERWELLNGELIMPPSPSTAHQRFPVDWRDGSTRSWRRGTLGRCSTRPSTWCCRT